jgi:hypothetical protein
MGKKVQFLLPILCVLTGCAVPAPIQELPAAAQAMAMAEPDRVVSPKFFTSTQSIAGCTDELVPYAQLEGGRGGEVWWGRGAEALARRLIAVMPDAFLYSEGASQVAGVVTTHVGFGVSSGSAIMVVPTKLQALRAARSRVPFEMHPQTSIVLSIRDKAAVGALTEGDTVVSIGGWSPVGTVPYEQSNLASQRLALLPGEELEIEWVRSGVGKMTGKVKMLPTDGAHRAISSAAKLLEGFEVRRYSDAAGKPIWGYYNMNPSSQYDM